jgi:predicted metal-dependent hydrolase
MEIGSAVGLDDSLRAGIAVHNAGFYHAAHDAWEDRWLDLEVGDEKDFLQGLIQFTAAVHHATNRNWEGATGLAGSAQRYLADLPADHEGVNVGAVRDWLARFERDPELVEREPVLALTHGTEVVGLADLEYPAVAVAAPLVAEATGHDEAVVERGAEYALADLAADEVGSPFVTLVLDVLTAGERRPVVVQRLEQHVERRQSKEDDVAELFD